MRLTFATPAKVLPGPRPQTRPAGVTYAVQYRVDPGQPSTNGYYVVELGEGTELRAFGPWDHERQAESYRQYLEEFPVGDPRD